MPCICQLFPIFICFLFQVLCNDETLDICKKAAGSWKVESKGSQKVVLSGCDITQIRREDELLFMITRGSLSDYGKYEILKVEDVSG